MALLICPVCEEEYDDRLKCYVCDFILEKCWRRLKTDHLCRLKIDQGI